MLAAGTGLLNQGAVQFILFTVMILVTFVILWIVISK